MTADFKEQIAVDHEENVFRLAVLGAAAQIGEKLLVEAKDECKNQPSALSMNRLQKQLSRKAAGEHLRAFGRAAWRVGSRVAVAIIIIVTVSFSLIMSVDAMRAQFARFLVSFHDDHMEVGLSSNDEPGTIQSDQIIKITSGYVPSYIPDGFQITSMKIEDYINDIEYRDENGSIIHFTGYTQGAAANIDTENADLLETVDISGEPGMIIKKKGIFIVTWTLDDFFFILTAPTSMQDALKMAESVKPGK